MISKLKNRLFLRKYIKVTNRHFNKVLSELIAKANIAETKINETLHNYSHIVLELKKDCNKNSNQRTFPESVTKVALIRTERMWKCYSSKFEERSDGLKCFWDIALLNETNVENIKHTSNLELTKKVWRQLKSQQEIWFEDGYLNIEATLKTLTFEERNYFMIIDHIFDKTDELKELCTIKCDYPASQCFTLNYDFPHIDINDNVYGLDFFHEKISQHCLISFIERANSRSDTDHFQRFYMSKYHPKIIRNDIDKIIPFYIRTMFYDIYVKDELFSHIRVHSKVKTNNSYFDAIFPEITKRYIEAVYCLLYKQ